jgi:hypothetical protein
MGQGKIICFTNIETIEHDGYPLKMRKRKTSAHSAPTISTSTALIMLPPENA